MYKHLTREQRYAIYLGKQKGETLETIARSIGVHKSTVSREVRRNSTPNGKYVWNKAHDKADSRQVRTPGNRKLDDVLKWRVIELIKNEQWSPRQISGRLKREGISVSHETVYAIIRKDGSGELASHCRHRMKYRRKALLMEKLRHGKKAKPLAKAVWRLLLPYKGEALKSITTDNGSEFAEHEWITRKLHVPIFFADSYCAWQKGAIENGNKLIRQYIPKGTDISTITDGKIARIRKKINARPREKLNFLTPAECFFKNIP